MKIIFENSNDRYIQCLASASSALWPNEINFWDRRIKPTLDMLKEINPELIVLNSYDEMLLKEIYVAKHKGYLGKFVLISDNSVNGFDSVEPEKPCVNIMQLLNGAKKPHLESNVSVLIDNNFRKDPMIYPILSMLKSRGDCKVFGKGPVDINMSNYMGAVDTGTLADIIASSETYLDFTSKYGGLDSSIYSDRISLIYKNKCDFASTFNNVEELQGLLDNKQSVAVPFYEYCGLLSSCSTVEDLLKGVGLDNVHRQEKINLLNTKLQGKLNDRNNVSKIK